MAFWTKDIMAEDLAKNDWEVGDYSYGAPVVHTWAVNGGLRIGKYCSFGAGVLIMLGGNHRVDWITTYPFSAIPFEYPEASHIEGHPATRGDVVIGNDVWFGQSSVILNGVTIGDGAVIGAHALVTRDVLPYAIVGGNPAGIIRKRFSDEQIKALLEVKWWDWPRDKLKNFYESLLSNDIESFILRAKANHS